MLKNQDKVLSGLLILCIDAKNYYESASSQAENSHLRSVFKGLAGVHKSIIYDLQTFASNKNDRFRKNGSIVGKVRQLSGQLNAIFSDTDRTLISEFEELENNIIAAFDTALEERMQPEAINVVGNQISKLKDNHEHLRNLQYYLKSADEN